MKRNFVPPLVLYPDIKPPVFIAFPPTGGLMIVIASKFGSIPAEIAVRPHYLIQINSSTYSSMKLEADLEIRKYVSMINPYSENQDPEDFLKKSKIFWGEN